MTRTILHNKLMIKSLRHDVGEALLGFSNRAINVAIKDCCLEHE